VSLLLVGGGYRGEGIIIHNILCSVKLNLDQSPF
jgi:hypothetical protein